MREKERYRREEEGGERELYKGGGYAGEERRVR